MVTTLAEATAQINREIAVYIDRKGYVLDIRVGDSKAVALGEVEGRRKETGLSGVRCVHTHPSGSSALSEEDISALKQLHLDMIAAVGVMHGKTTGASVALPGEDLMKVEIFGPFHPDQPELHRLIDLIAGRDKPGKDLSAINEKDSARAL